ncbi:MAG TPA: hypothetical protein PLX02_04735 [Syntrophorhabdaceae bacterium]|nr:hypothetical protein [Syntrophorhabdaceae bacterium]HQM80908.1 hypothetical protein [Syntrophorhabdaceae bacterium]
MGRVKYCGNCNPEVDPRKIRKAVEKIASETDDDVLICVNGCSRMCMTKKMKSDLTQKRLDLFVREVFEQESRRVDKGGKE